MSRGTQDSTNNPNRDLKNSESDNEGDFEGDLEYENDKDQIVEQSPRGRFIRFNEELGTGAYKIVHKAYDNDSGCEVAWNIIKLQRLPPKERKRISDEINLLKSLKHPNIIHFISAWINRQREEVVFITEIVTGGSLKSYLRKIKTPRLKVIKSWCREILQGLEYLHSMNPSPIIHRDIKCDNIFINSNKGEIRIGDLGLATCMTTAFANSVLGTPEFMAPEMYEEVYGPTVDVYSFGMCVLEMVTQQTPYRECGNPAQVYKKVMNGTKPKSLDLICNEDVKHFILECLKDKDERPTASELLLSKFLQQSDEADNYPIKLADYTHANQTIEEESCEDISRHSEKPRRDGFMPFNHAKSENPLIMGMDDRSKLPDAEAKQRISERNINTDHVFAFDLQQSTLDKSSKDESPTSPPKPNSSNKEDENQFNYELTIKWVSEQNVYVMLKKEKQDWNYLKEKLIQLDRKRFTVEALIHAVKQELDLQTICPRLAQAISTFADSTECGSLNTSPKGQAHNSSKISSNTSFSTANPNSTYFNQHHTQALFAPNNTNKQQETITAYSYLEKGVAAMSHSNNAYFFQSEFFMNYYYQYLNSLPRDYFQYETEDSMGLRHKAELLELQNVHLIQKRSLFERRQGYLHGCKNSLNIPNFPCDFTPNEQEDHQKHQNQIGDDPLPFSPFSSGSMSPNDAVINGETGFSSHNNSVEIITSIIGKLNNHNNSAFEEDNKSSLQMTSGDYTPNAHIHNSHLINNIGNSVSISHSASNVSCANTLTANVQTISFNPSSHSSSMYSNSQNYRYHRISPKGADGNPQLFGGQTKKQTQPEGSQKKILSPILHDSSREYQQFRKAQASNNLHNMIHSHSITYEVLAKLETAGIHPIFSGTNDNLVHNESQQQKVHKIPKDNTDLEFVAVRGTHSDNKRTSTLPPRTSAKQNLIDIPKTNLLDFNVQNELSSKDTNISTGCVANIVLRAASQTTNDHTTETQLINPTIKTNQVLDRDRTISFGAVQTTNFIVQQQCDSQQSTPQNNGIEARHEFSDTHSLSFNAGQLSISNYNSQASYETPRIWSNLSPSSPSRKSKAKSPSLSCLDTNTVQAISSESKVSPLVKGLSGEHISIKNVVFNGTSSQFSASFNQQARGERNFNINLSLESNNHIQQKKTSSSSNLNLTKTNDIFNCRGQKININEIEKIKAHSIRSELRREGLNMNEEDIKSAQACLNIITNNALEPNGHFGHYTEKVVKSYQEKNGMRIDGIINEHVWAQMKADLEKTIMTKSQEKEREIREMANKTLENKKMMKDKQMKEAAESLNKIQQELTDLTSL